MRPGLKPEFNQSYDPNVFLLPTSLKQTVQFFGT